VQSGLGEHVHLAAEEVLEVHEQAAEVEQAPAGLHVHEEIHVAGVIGLTFRDRAKDADVRRPVRAARARTASRLSPMISSIPMNDDP